MMAMLCALVVGFVVRHVASNWGAVAATRIAAPEWLALGTSLGATGLLGFAWICQRLLILALQRADLSLAQAVGVVYVPMLARYLPGRGWTIPVSFWAYARIGVSAREAAPCIGWLFLLSLGSSALVSALLGVGPPGPVSRFGIFAGVACAAAALWGISRTFQRPADRRSRWIRSAGIGRVRLSSGGLVGLFVANSLAWLTYGAGFYCLVCSVGPAPAAEAPRIAALFAFAQIAGFLAVFSPAGIGVREAVFLVGLTPVIGEANAIVVALLCRIWQTALELLLAGLGSWALYLARRDTVSA